MTQSKLLYLKQLSLIGFIHSFTVVKLAAALCFPHRARQFSSTQSLLAIPCVDHDLLHHHQAEVWAHQVFTPPEHTGSVSLNSNLALITLLPTGPTMNLHSQRWRQRWRTPARLHNDCVESGLVMWFVIPLARTDAITGWATACRVTRDDGLW